MQIDQDIGSEISSSLLCTIETKKINLQGYKEKKMFHL